jgi:plastocyanin
MRLYFPRFPFSRRSFWMVLLLAIAASLLFAACGGSTTTASSSTPTPTTAPPTPTPTPSPTPVPATVPLGAVVVQMIENPPGHYLFQPASVTVKAGTVVVWIDNSDAPHTVTSDPGAPSAFNTTSNVTEGHTFALVFNTPGTYHYHCNIHPTTMKAVINVTS